MLWVGVAAFTVAGVLVALVIPDSDRTGSALFGATLFACGVGFWRMGIYPQLTATLERLEVRNAFVTTRLAWSDIQTVRAGYAGLEIVRSDGSETTATAVQQANISVWLHRPTRAQAIAAELTQLSQVRGGSQ